MRKRIITLSILFLLAITVLTGCNNGNQDVNPEIFTLKNQNSEDVTLVGEKPTLLFFFTTYT